MSARTGAAALTAVPLAVMLAGCGGTAAPADSGSVSPATPVPTSTVPVSIEAPIACAQMEQSFTPLAVAASDYLVSVDPASPCTEGKGLTVLIFNVPVPATGAVQVNPGSQQAATFAAEDAGAGVRIEYEPGSDGTYAVASQTPAP